MCLEICGRETWGSGAGGRRGEVNSSSQSGFDVISRCESEDSAQLALARREHSGTLATAIARAGWVFPERNRFGGGVTLSLVRGCSFYSLPFRQRPAERDSPRKTATNTRYWTQSNQCQRKSARQVNGHRVFTPAPPSGRARHSLHPRRAAASAPRCTAAGLVRRRCRLP